MTHTHSQRGLLLIGVFKLLKCLTLIAMGVGALKLLNQDLAARMKDWIDALNLGPGRHYVYRILEKFSNLDPHKLKELSIGTFLYAGIYLTEGVGLVLRKRWAEYLTIISTAGFLPLEVYEILKRANFVRTGVLLVNVAIVVYLIWDLRSAGKRVREMEAAAVPQ